MSAPRDVAEPVESSTVPESTAARDDRTGPERSRRLLLVGGWAATGAYLALYLNRGWFPHDDGALGQSAERVLAGQLPHRDFDDTYTGGLDYLHALAFLVFGHELSSMRIALFVFFLAWVPALYFVARRFASTGAAMAVVFACVVWSVPNYTASMPSWYNLFFATFALAATLRFVDTRARAYLFLAGLACGLSMTAKITGVYALAATVLALVFVEQEAFGVRLGERRWSWYSAVLAFVLGSAVVAGGLGSLISPRIAGPEILDYVLPVSALCAFVVWNEFRSPRDTSRLRVVRLASLVWPVLAGVAIVLLLFGLPYIVSGGFGALVDGVLVEPATRLEFAFLAPPSLGSLVDAMIVAAPILLALAFVASGRVARVSQAVLVVVLLVVLLLAGTNEEFRHDVWLAFRWLGRVFLPVAVISMWVRDRSAGGEAGREQRVDLFLVLAFAAWTALIQYPFAAPIYFSYTAPFVVLAIAAFERWRVAAGGRPLRTSVVSSLVAFVLAFGVLVLNPTGVSGFAGDKARLGLPHTGRLHVLRSDATMYQRLVRTIDRHARGPWLYAGPDAPEVYYLSGRDNRTPFLFDFLEDEGERERAIESVLRDPRLGVAVVNVDPEFSPPLDHRLVRLLERRFPHATRIGHFDVRWAS